MRSPFCGLEFRECRGGVCPPDVAEGVNILPQYLPLRLLSFIPFCSLSILTFCRSKSYKNARYGKNSRSVLLLVPHTASTRSNLVCRSNLFVSVQALRDLCGLALLRKNITLPHFKQFLACSWTSTASHSIFDGAGFIFEITLVRGYILSPCFRVDEAERRRGVSYGQTDVSAHTLSLIVHR